MIYRIKNLRVDHERKTSGAILIDSLEIERGTTVALLGRNGSGKTTLLETLAGLLPFEGTIELDGEKVPGNAEWPLHLKRKVSLVLQNPYLFKMSVLDNIILPLLERKVNKEAARKKACDSLAMVGLELFAERDARSLSAGEARRVAIARALALEPEILLLDEPAANVDEESEILILGLLDRMKRSGKKTLLFSSHSRYHAELLADRIFTLHRGRLAEGPAPNTFIATISKIESSSDTTESLARVDENLEFWITGKHEGQVLLSIPAEAIILSETPLLSSARNSFTGTVVQMSMAQNGIRVTVDTGRRLTAIITSASARELSLVPGKKITLTFKASAVRVLDL